MTLGEIADELDAIARALPTALVPTTLPVSKAARRAYILGIARVAIQERADQLRQMEPRPGRDRVTPFQTP
jgi:hypothetical protein